MKSHAARAAAAVALMTALVAGAVITVKAANGGYAGRYVVSGIFSGTGQGLYPGSDVDYRGVPVGTVKSISLAGYRTKVVMAVDPGFRIPRSARATIRPKNVFGTEEVSLSFPAGRGGPYVAPGSQVGHTAVSAEIGDLLATADPVLRSLDAQALSTVISELAQASNGEGPTIARGFRSGSQVATLLADTIDAQIAALQAFDAFQGALAGTGPLFNTLAADSNVALPVLDKAAPSFRRMLATLTPLSNDIASLVRAYRPDIQALLANGDNVNRVLLAHQSDLENLIQGLYEYVYKIGNGASAESLPDGTHFAYFKTFVLMSDVNAFVCSIMQPEMTSPSSPGVPDPLAYLAPLETALAATGGPIDCGSPSPTTAGPDVAPNAASTLSALAQQVYAALGSPQPAGSGSQPGSGSKTSLQQILGWLG